MTLFPHLGASHSISFMLEINVLQNPYPSAHQFSPLAETFIVLFFEGFFSLQITLKIKIDKAEHRPGMKYGKFKLISNSYFIVVFENKITLLKNARETQRIKLYEINLPILILQQTYFIPNLSYFAGPHYLRATFLVVFSFYFHSGMLTVLCFQIRMLGSLHYY